MVVSKKVVAKRTTIYRYVVSVFLILSGIIFKTFNIGNNEFDSFNRAAYFLIYVGFLTLIVSIITNFTKRKRIIDERDEKIGYEAYRWTFTTIFIVGFLLMIYSLVVEVQVLLSDFIPFTIRFILLVYFISYKILERHN